MRLYRDWGRRVVVNGQWSGATSSKIQFSTVVVDQSQSLESCDSGMLSDLDPIGYSVGQPWVILLVGGLRMVGVTKWCPQAKSRTRATKRREQSKKARVEYVLRSNIIGILQSSSPLELSVKELATRKPKRQPSA